MYYRNLARSVLPVLAKPRHTPRRQRRETIMKRIAKAALITGLAVGLATAATAQMRRGAGRGTGPQVDMGAATTVAGSVVSFQAGAGMGMPALVVAVDGGEGQSFVLGPYRYLQAQGFTAKEGDRVEVTTVPCTACPNGSAVVSVHNVSTSATLTLRGEDGVPLWTGGRGAGRGMRGGGSCQGTGQGMGAGAAMGPGRGRGAGMGRAAGLCNGTGPDMAKAAAYSGTVKAFTGGAGQGFPTLVLETAGGEVSVMVSPYRALMRAGYTPAAGTAVEVTAAPVAVDGAEQLVAITLKDVASGLEIGLRDPQTGFPIGGRRF